MDLDNHDNEVFSEEVKSFGLSRLAKMKSANSSACGIDSIPAVDEYLTGEFTFIIVDLFSAHPDHSIGSLNRVCICYC